MKVIAAPSLLDRYLPDFQFREVHTITVAAPPEQIFQAVMEVTPGEIRLAGALFWVRALPARLAGRRVSPFAAHTPFLQQAITPTGGFVLLAQSPREVVIGTVGQFWQVRGGSYPGLDDAQGFADFADPAYAKAAIDFVIEPTQDGTSRLHTETRIVAGSRAARRRFAVYWWLIHPGSALLRRLWLGAIKHRAERSVPTSR